MFDPEGGMHQPRLQVFRLERGIYKRVNWWANPDGPLAVTSETLALELRFQDDRMRLWDRQARAYLREHRDERDERLNALARYEEQRTGRLEERDKRIEERDKRIAAEQRMRDLDSQLADLKERRPGKH